MLTRRAQNRALLARQLLLTRSATHSVQGAVEHLVGLQAQTPRDPYLALWSRLDGFDPHALGALLTERRVVRMTLMRATVHLVAARDAVWLRPQVQPGIERSFNGTWRKRVEGVDLDAVVACAHRILERSPVALTGRELAERVAIDPGVRASVEPGITLDAEAIRHAINTRAALVQVPPRGVWGRSGQPKYAALDGLINDTERHGLGGNLEELVVRYLRAFGPASVRDLQKWSGLTRCATVVDRLRPQLLAFRSENGIELFDLPDAPRPDPETPAPIRFLPEFDNVLLSHADRGHVTPNGETPWLDAIDAGRHVGNVLVDGLLRATWWLERKDPRGVTLAVRPLGRITRHERAELRDEAGRFAGIAGAGAGDVRLATST